MRGGNHVFTSIFFVSGWPKAFIGNFSVIQKNSGCEKIAWMREGDITFFRCNLFVSESPKTFNANSSVFQKISGRENVLWMRGGTSRLPVEFFLSHPTENFHWDLFGVSGCEKFVWMKKRISRFSVEKNLNHIIGRFHWETSVFQKCSGSGNVAWLRKGDITFFFRIFSVSDFRKFSLGTLRCFRKFLAVKIFNGCEGAYHVLQSNSSCLTLPKKFLWDLFSLSKKFWLRKLGMDARGISRFSVEGFWSHISENFHWELFSVSRNMSQRKICMDERRRYHVLPSKFFKSQYRRNSLANLRRFRNFLVWGEKYE